MNTKKELLKRLEEETKVLQNPLVKKAFEKIDRADFVDGDYVVEAYEDYALPTRSGQTISQPTTMAFMLELLDAKPGEKVLDIGSGSGWSTALLAEMVGKDGFVYGVEIEPELVEMGKANLKKYPELKAQISKAGEGIGFPQKFLYDRILVNAAATEIPEAILGQLDIGGVLVIPVNDILTRVSKISEDKIEKKEFPGFLFGPLV